MSTKPANIFLEQYYSQHNEEERLGSRHGRVEFITTMKYIHDFVKPGAKILEAGAGTGIYFCGILHE